MTKFEEFEQRNRGQKLMYYDSPEGFRGVAVRSTLGTSGARLPSPNGQWPDKYTPRR